MIVESSEIASTDVHLDTVQQTEDIDDKYSEENDKSSVSQKIEMLQGDFITIRSETTTDGESITLF